MDDGLHADPALLKTGVPGFDEVLAGGLTPNRVYLVEGDPGAGKTTLALQFLMEGRRNGEQGLYVTLSETRDELIGVAASHGWDLDGIKITELAIAEASLDADAENTMFHPSEVELAQMAEVVLREVEASRPSRIVFDSLSEMRLMAQNSLRYRRQILALKQFFVGRQCTVLLLDDGTAALTDIQVQSVVHGVIALQQSAPDYGSTQRRLEVTKMRGRAFRSGYHDYKIAHGGVQVFPRLTAAEHHAAFPLTKVQSGLAKLDALLGGGLDRGTSALLLGPAGAGKSTIALQYAVAAAQRGERAAMLLFDEGVMTLFARAAGIGIPLRDYVDRGFISIRQVDPGQLSPGELICYVRDEVQHRQARIVVIDSLNGYLNSLPQAQSLSIQLHELLSYLGQSGVTSLLVISQSGLVGSQLETPVDASYIADTIIVLRFFEALGTVRQAISVMKKRSGNHERSIREFRFDPDGIHIGPPLRQFDGVLTGVPTYRGEDRSLLDANDA